MQKYSYKNLGQERFDAKYPAFVDVRKYSRRELIPLDDEYTAICGSDSTVRYDRVNFLRKYSTEIEQIINNKENTYRFNNDYTICTTIAKDKYYLHSTSKALITLTAISLLSKDKTVNLVIEDYLGYQYTLITEDILMQYFLIPNKIILDEQYSELVDNNTSLRTKPDIKDLYNITTNYNDIRELVKQGALINDVFPRLNQEASKVEMFTNKYLQDIPFTSLVPASLKSNIVMFGPVILGSILGNVTQDDILYLAIISQKNNHSQLIKQFLTTQSFNIQEEDDNYVLTLPNKQTIILVAKKYTSLEQVMATIALPADEIAYHNDNYFVTKNYVRVLRHRANTVMLEDINSTYVRRLIASSKKGFRIEVPINVIMPASVSTNLQTNFNDLQSILAVQNGQPYTVVNKLSPTDEIVFQEVKYIDGYHKYLASGLGKHEYYNWYNWTYIPDIDAIYTPSAFT